MKKFTFRIINGAEGFTYEYGNKITINADSIDDAKMKFNDIMKITSEPFDYTIEEDTTEDFDTNDWLKSFNI